jgi:fructose-1,6-bisphosphatase I/sedoheptulose-1,7-bisphosphatase
MLAERTTLTQFLIEERRKHPDASGELNALILDVALACKAISRAVARGALDGDRTEVANALFLRSNEWGGHLAGMLSAAMEGLHRIPERYPRGRYLLAFDPLEGADGTDVNGPVGSVFSILRATTGPGDATERDFLQRGSEQVCGGYAIYGPATMLVLTVGTGVHGFTLDPVLGEFFVTHPDLRIPAATRELAIDAATTRFWEPAVRRYVEECLAGQSGVRRKDFAMRWIASLVGETHRILMRGGVFLWPRDTRDAPRAGHVRLLHAASPIAFVVEQADGRASTGRGAVLDCAPASVEERAPLIFGSRDEVARIEQYHRDHNLREPDLPLFAVRGLFRVAH